MASTITSPLRVDVGSSRHDLGVTVTSERQTGSDVIEDRVDGQQAENGTSDSETGSSSGDDENATADVSDGGATSQRRQAAPCYRHIISHVEQSSSLYRDKHLFQ